MKRLAKKLIPAGMIVGVLTGLRLLITNTSNVSANPVGFAAIGAWIAIIYGLAGGLAGLIFAALYAGYTRQFGDGGEVRRGRGAAKTLFWLTGGIALLTYSIIAPHSPVPQLYLLAASAYVLYLAVRSHQSEGAEHTPACSPLAHLVGAAAAAGVFAVGLRAARSGLTPVGGIGGQLIAALVAFVIGVVAWYVVNALIAAIASRTSPVVANTVIGVIAAAAVLAVALSPIVTIERYLSGEVAALPSASADAGAPNIILLSVDTLRADYVGYEGGPVRTPTIDALAAESYIFENAYANAPWTRPSFAAFFSSRYPSEMGVGRLPGTGKADKGPMPYEWRQDRKMLAEVFKDEGYATAAAVTNGHLTRRAHADQGFDLFHHCVLAEGVMPEAIVNLVGALFDLPPSVGHVSDKERSNVVSMRGVQIIRESSTRPLFMWLHYLDPHQPYDAPTLDEEDKVHPPHLSARARQAACSPSSRARYLRAYAAEVEYHDDWLKPVIDQLKTSGLWDSSIVVFWSDHGEEFWDHGGFEHGHTLYNELVHIPLLIHLPGQTESHRVEQTVTLLDVMPTLIDYCGVPAPADMQGQSLRGLMEGTDQDYACNAFMECCVWGGVRKALVTDRWKLIYDLYHDDFALYDMKTDPTERCDLHGTEAAPDTSDMEQQLLQWVEDSHAMMREHLSAGAAEVQDPGIQQNLKDMGYVQ